MPVINAVGEIQSGDGSGINSSDTVYADQMVSAFYQAAGYPRVKAIVLRINSPGGSEAAAESTFIRSVRGFGYSFNSEVPQEQVQ